MMVTKSILFSWLCVAVKAELQIGVGIHDVS